MALKLLGSLESSGGNVGIGTTSPVSTLHIKTSVDNSVAQGLVIERSTNSDRGYINYNGGGFQFRSTVGDPIVFGETDAEHMRILPDGNVGIGTASPTDKLHVLGTINVGDNKVYNGAANNSAGFELIGSRFNIHGYHGITFNASNAAIGSQTERMRITSAGNVGIGTTSPYTKLVVGSRGTAAATSILAYDGIAFDFYNDGSPYKRHGVIISQAADASESVLDFNTKAASGTNSTKMTILGNGNVGIGTTSPGNRLRIDAAAGQATTLANSITNAAVYINSDTGNGSNNIRIGESGNGSYFLQVSNSAGTSPYDINLNPFGGNVGIGTTSPGTKLHVAGNLLIGSTYTQPSGSVWTTSNSQLILGGAHNAEVNDDNPGVKLLITGYDNDLSTAIYPIYAEDENGLVDFWIKNRQGASNGPTMYFAGNVGIGTTSPGAKLHISGDVTGTNKVLIENTDDGTNSYAGLGFQSDFGHTYHPGILLNSSTNTAYGGVDSLNIWQYHSKPITLVTNNVVRAIVTGDGNVGIGTTSPSTKLDVNGVITATSGNSSNWNTAYGWGNHAGLYLGATAKAADSNLLDGIDSGSFLRSDAADTATGEILFDAGFKSDPIMLSGSQNFDNISRSGFYNLYNTSTGSTNSPGFPYGTMIVVGNNKQSQGFGFQLAHERLNTAGNFKVRGMNDSASAWSSWATVWTSLDFANNSANWNTAYTDRNKWDGGSTGLNAATGRTSLGLGTLATLSTVNAATITDNSVGAAELNVTGNGSNGQVLTSDGDGTFSWTAKTTNTDTITSVGLSGSETAGTVTLTGAGATTLTQVGGTIEIRSTDTNTTYTVGDGGLTQNNFTTTLKNKLDGIATSANNYSLPAGTSLVRGGFKIGYTENGKNYPVEVSSEKMYVNVPWTDTNTDTITSVGVSGSETNGTITLTGAGATTITQSGGAIEIRSTDTNTTYSVGDNGLTEKNFTGTLKTKLDGIALLQITTLCQ
jgi:hypothetical protein